MARFETLKTSRFASLAVDAPKGEVARNRQRDAEQPWRRWYKTAKWRELKERVHIRDRHRCKVTGVRCLGRHPAPDSPVADHIVSPGAVWLLTGSIEETARVFWDEANVRTVSKTYHDGQRQREQKEAARFG